MLLKDKIAIVTGGARGIGRAICHEYSKEGADIILGDIDIDKAKKTSKELEDLFNRKCIAVKLDISNRKNVEEVIGETINIFGKIDILVNNAAIFFEEYIVDMKEEQWDRLMDINLKGTYLCSQAVGRHMIKQKGGKIITISSCTAKKPTLKEAAYSASKAGVIGFNRVMAAEFGPYGINCNAILPGATDTEMIRKTFLTSPEIENEWIEKTALKRLGKPVDVARVALFLASGLSDHITGEGIVVSAGEMMSQ
ncbi:MAG: SDR family NAD(P)-dependent oxidoreductase [Candidatus Humimicrobiaceae bacterium]